MSLNFPLPSSPHCDPSMIWLMVVEFAGRTHAMPVASEGKRPRKTRAGLPSKKSTAGHRRLACACLACPDYSARLVGHQGPGSSVRTRASFYRKCLIIPK